MQLAVKSFNRCRGEGIDFEARESSRASAMGVEDRQGLGRWSLCAIAVAQRSSMGDLSARGRLVANRIMKRDSLSSRVCRFCGLRVVECVVYARNSLGTLR